MSGKSFKSLTSTKPDKVIFNNDGTVYIKFTGTNLIGVKTINEYYVRYDPKIKMWAGIDKK